LSFDDADKKIYTIGRSKKCDLIISDPYISRLHCTIGMIPDDKYLRIEDKNCHYVLFDGFLGQKLSKYGIWIEEQRQSIIYLLSEAIISISPQTNLQYMYIKTEDKMITLS